MCETCDELLESVCVCSVETGRTAATLAMFVFLSLSIQPYTHMH